MSLQENRTWKSDSCDKTRYECVNSVLYNIRTVCGWRSEQTDCCACMWKKNQSCLEKLVCVCLATCKFDLGLSKLCLYLIVRPLKTGEELWGLKWLEWRILVRYPVQVCGPVQRTGYVLTFQRYCSLHHQAWWWRQEYLWNTHSNVHNCHHDNVTCLLR